MPSNSTPAKDFHSWLLSFIAWGQAIGRHDHVHAFLNWRKQLVIYDDVNVNTMIAIDLDGRKVPVPHILKSVNRRFVQDLSAKIRSVQTSPGVSREVGFMCWFLVFPWALRRFFYWVVTAYRSLSGKIPALS